MAKAPSQDPKYRLTMYLPPDDKERLKRIALKLKKSGVDGMFNTKGEVVQSAVIRWLIHNTPTD